MYINGKKPTTEQFIEKAKSIHGGKYDYSKVEYINSQTKVTIVCPIHGEFEQTPRLHFQTCGCKKCGIDYNGIRHRKNTKWFVEKAKEVHGNSYDYSKTVYTLAKNKVIITCPTHGDFEQYTSNHLAGRGCKKCGQLNQTTKMQKSLNKFMEEANNVHSNKYNYSKVNYVNTHTHVEIICPEHGVFLAAPHEHLKAKYGCPSCATTGFNPSNPAILYYVSVDSTHYKIGITNNDVSKRFSRKERDRMKIIKTWEFELGSDAKKAEQLLLDIFSKHIAEGYSELDSGNTEVFTHDVLKLDT